ncbi:MAG: cell division protein DivIVA [Actinobacteria bacterium HGW-Actinobacteria-4]|nr:MAG: cell division protein DivIVA [Actinobacteria bacterium HGW-Actinobacteria-4]
MSDLFPRAKKLKHGYNPGQVSEFLNRARQSYDRAPGGGPELTALDIRTAAFDLKRGGYSTAAVDAAMDRLEVAFAARDRENFVRSHGQDAWMQSLAHRAEVLYPRLRRPAGHKFSRPRGLRGGYDAKQVDALLARITAFFDRGEPLTAAEVRSVTFKHRSKFRAYNERTVDAYLARTVDVLLGVG